VIRTILQLGRVSNLPTAWTNVLAGWLITGGLFSTSSLVSLLILVTVSSLLYLGGMTLNDAAGASFDRKHAAHRPIPSGRISQAAVWSLGVGYLVGATVLATVFLAMAGAVWTLIVVGLILLYTFTHKRTSLCIFAMGAIRTGLYFIGSAAATGRMSPPSAVLIWGLALGVYIIVLTAIARREATGPRSMPRWLVTAALLVAPTVALLLTGATQSMLTIPIWIVLAGWVAFATAPLAKREIGSAVGRLLATMVLLDALAVSQVTTYLPVLLLLSLPLLLLWQRKIAAT